MRIHNEVVIDIATGTILYDDSYRYDGPIAECKSTKSTTRVENQIDYEYNKRMAAVAEQEMSMAQGYYNFWESDYKPLEQAQIEANTKLITPQTDLELAKIQQEQTLLPQQTELAQAQLGYGIEQISQAKPVMSEFYKQALQGVNVNQKVNQARADVTQALNESDNAAMRTAGRLGMSGRGLSALKQNSIDRTKAIAAAQTGARNQAEDTNFARLSNAANFASGIGA